jgi:aminoglycoside 6'-N-acetyltransferase I
LEPILAGDTPGAMPLINFVAEIADGTLAGFAEVDLRSHADGCDPKRPVGYLEGWYVIAEYRRSGVGRRLLAAAEEWARSHGCVEMASDTWIDNEVSQRCHEALGFEVVDRCVNYRKAL